MVDCLGLFEQTTHQATKGKRATQVYEILDLKHDRAGLTLVDTVSSSKINATMKEIGHPGSKFLLQ